MAVSVEQVHTGFLSAVLGRRSFRIPPSVFDIDHVGSDAVEESGFESCPSKGRLQIDPVTVDNAKGGRRIRLDLHQGIGMIPNL